MEITLKNVGLIENSTIKLDGLTVITGSNNSGKSTVGKALYSMLEGMRDVEKKLFDDMSKPYLDMLKLLNGTLGLNIIMKYIDEDDLPEGMLNILRNCSDLSHVKSPINIINTAENLLNIIDILNSDLLYNIIIKEKNIRNDVIGFIIGQFDSSKVKARSYVLTFLVKYKDITIEQYAKTSINSLLSTEFKGQIFPIKKHESDKVSHLSVQIDDNIGYCMTIRNNCEIADDYTSINGFYDKNIIFIDDPYILDGLSNSTNDHGSYNFNHSEKLKRLLSDNKPKSVLEQMVNAKAYKNISEMIAAIVPGHLTSDSNGFYFSDNASDSARLRVENMATGSKLFAILQTLLKNGDLDFDTMLILDEPESHLHPEWQNMLAEVIVLLVKEVDIKVLLTTHSINFVLALETYMRKYELEKVSNFYITEPLANGMITYKNSTDEMDRVYANFVRSFSEMKAERARYMGDD